MILYQPSSRQIKGLALAACKQWPEHNEMIMRAAALLDPLALFVDYDDSSPAITWSCNTSDNFPFTRYEIGCRWNATGPVSFDRSDSVCNCRDKRFHPYVFELDPYHLGNTPPPVATCEHALAWQMYRKIVELLGRELGYPEPLAPHVTLWKQSADTVNRLVLESDGLVEIAAHLAEHMLPVHLIADTVTAEPVFEMYEPPF